MTANIQRPIFRMRRTLTICSAVNFPRLSVNMSFWCVCRTFFGMLSNSISRRWRHRNLIAKCSRRRQSYTNYYNFLCCTTRNIPFLLEKKLFHFLHHNTWWMHMHTYVIGDISFPLGCFSHVIKHNRMYVEVYLWFVTEELNATEREIHYFIVYSPYCSSSVWRIFRSFMWTRWDRIVAQRQGRVWHHTIVTFRKTKATTTTTKYILLRFIFHFCIIVIRERVTHLTSTAVHGTFLFSVWMTSVLYTAYM